MMLPISREMRMFASDGRCTISADTENNVRVRTDLAPQRPLAGPADANDLKHAPSHQMGHKLKVQMRRPVAILGFGSEQADRGALADLLT